MKKFCLAASLLVFSAPGLMAQFSAHFINVGQGDSTYIVLPNGHNVLIDGGPSGQPVYNFLKAKGVKTIDHVVLTHPHGDHFMGLKTVFRNFQVKNFYDTRADNTDAVMDDEVRAQAAAMPGCKIHYPESGSTLNWDSRVTVKVLNTCSAPVKTKDSAELNNCSIVMRFFYNGHGLLMTGDIESPIENAMTKIFKSGL
ncbi:MAG: MBL fold metallo-hydrolase, partial [Elusimicrobiales bacterium]